MCVFSVFLLLGVGDGGYGGGAAVAAFVMGMER